MYEFVHFRVSEFMSPEPVTVRPDTPLGEVQTIFERHGFNGLPVLDDNGGMVGLITKMDVLRAFTLEPGNIVPPYGTIMTYPTSTVMNRELVTVPPDAPLTRVLQRLVNLRVKSLPVVENKTLVGIIAREDVLRALQKATAQ